MEETRLVFNGFKEPFPDLLQVFSNKNLLHYTDLDYCDSVSDSKLLQWCNDSDRISIVGYCKGDFVGFASAHLVMKHVTASITVVVVEKYQGNGFSKLLLKELMKKLQSMGIVRIEAQICTENVSSVNMIESLGFTREGVLRKNFLIEGILYDSYMYAKIVGE